ncbi:MAG: DUF1553 domain-containing protein, partial [Bacteroidota bacterium]
SIMAFDASDRNTCVVRRQNTNTPMQALVLMNDPTYVEAARILAERMQKEGGDQLDSQIAYGFRLLTGRQLKAKELQLFKELYQSEKEIFIEDASRAEGLMAVGEKEPDPNLDLHETAALTMVASMMINHDACYTKR